MKIATIVACFVVVGCAPQPGPVFFDKFFPVPGCDIALATENVYTGSGVLDVAPGNAEFWLGAKVHGQLVSQEVSVAGLSLEQANSQSFVLDTTVLSYSTKIGKIKTAQVPQRSTFEPATKSERYFYFNLITSDAATVLDNAPLTTAKYPGPVPATERADLLVTVEFTGFTTGTGNRITSGPQTYPLIVYKTDSASFQAGGCKKFASNLGACNYGGAAGEGQRPQLVCCDNAVLGTPGC